MRTTVGIVGLLLKCWESREAELHTVLVKTVMPLQPLLVMLVV